MEVRERTVYINNKPLAESQAIWEHGGIREGYFGPRTVPAGHVFLMGDNRDNSRDSRFWTEHFLPITRIKGRALVIYWSFYSMSRMGKVIR